MSELTTDVSITEINDEDLAEFLLECDKNAALAQAPVGPVLAPVPVEPPQNPVPDMERWYQENGLAPVRDHGNGLGGRALVPQSSSNNNSNDPFLRLSSPIAFPVLISVIPLGLATAHIDMASRDNATILIHLSSNIMDLEAEIREKTSVEGDVEIVLSKVIYDGANGTATAIKLHPVHHDNMTEVVTVLSRATYGELILEVRFGDEDEEEPEPDAEAEDESRETEKDVSPSSSGKIEALFSISTRLLHIEKKKVRLTLRHGVFLLAASLGLTSEIY